MNVIFRKWDVVLLAYPFSDLSASKVRPAVVISPDSENGKLDDSVFLFITSNTSRQSPFDLVIEISHPEFVSTGLLNSSAIRVNKVWTLRSTLVHKVLGRLGPQLRKNVLSCLASYLEIPQS